MALPAPVHRATASRHLLRDTRGATMVEYTVLLCLVTLVGAAAVASMGVPMVRLFRFMQLVLTLPFP